MADSFSPFPLLIDASGGVLVQRTVTYTGGTVSVNAGFTKLAVIGTIVLEALGRPIDFSLEGLLNGPGLVSAADFQLTQDGEPIKTWRKIPVQSPDSFDPDYPPNFKVEYSAVPSAGSHNFEWWWRNNGPGPISIPASAGDPLQAVARFV